MACNSSCKASLINASELRHRVTFQRTKQTEDTAGGFTESWIDIASVWAKIEPVKSYERFVAMQTETHVSHKITIRYNKDVTTAKRMLFDGRVFDITGVVNVNEDNIAMVITAIEGTL
jgi:SPP1 family predicted phage head-tail adaptor